MNATSNLCELSCANTAVSDLPFFDIWHLNIDDFIALLFDKVVQGIVALLLHARVSVTPPGAVNTKDALGRGGGRNRECEFALGRALGVGLGHGAVGDGEVGHVGCHGTHDAAGDGHGAGTVLAGLETVDAVIHGGNADASSRVGGYGEGDDAGGDGGACARG